MRRHVISVLLCLGSVLAAAASRTASEVLIRWGGSTDSNMVSPATGLPADPAVVKPLWELRVGSRQYTTPTIDRGRIYIGANDAGLDRQGVRSTGGGILLCVEQTTGKPIWQFISPRFFEGVTDPYHFNQWKCGICSGPVVDGDRVYIVGNRGEILCLDREGQANGNDGPFTDELTYMGAAPGTKLQPTDGDVIWRYNLLTELDVVPHDICGSTILLNGDLLYACTSNGIGPRHRVVPRPDAPSLIVLEKTTGTLVATDGEKIGRRMFHGHWSSPIYGNVNGKPMIYFGGGDGILYAFEPAQPRQEGSGIQTLKKIWSHDCNPRQYRTHHGQPIPYSRWNRNSPEGPSEIIGAPVFHNNRLYVVIGQSPLHGPGRGQLSCLDAASGKAVWTSKRVDRSLATVSIADGLLYVVDYSGFLYCFDADTGKLYWEHEMGAGAWDASTLVADGKIYASTEKKKIMWVLQAGREKEILSRTRFNTSPIRPVAVDGILYVPTQKRLIAYPGKATATATSGE